MCVRTRPLGSDRAAGLSVGSAPFPAPAVFVRRSLLLSSAQLVSVLCEAGSTVTAVVASRDCTLRFPPFL